MRLTYEWDLINNIHYKGQIPTAKAIGVDN